MDTQEHRRATAALAGAKAVRDQIRALAVDLDAAIETIRSVLDSSVSDSTVDTLRQEMSMLLARADDADTQIAALREDCADLAGKLARAEAALEACSMGCQPAPGSSELQLAGQVGRDKLVVAGPHDLPNGVLPRTGPAHDHQGAPDMAWFYTATGDWSVDATRGTAPVEGVDGVLRIKLAAEDWHAKDGGGTGTHHQWFFADRPVTELTMEFWHLFATEELGWTGKAGGFGRFSRDWPKGWNDWPSGGRRPEHTCLVRACHSKFGQAAPGAPVLMDVIKTGHVVPPNRVTGPAGERLHVWQGAEGQTNPEYSIGVPNTVVGAPPIGSWIGVRYVASWGTTGRPDGVLESWVAVEPGASSPAGAERVLWTRAARVAGIDWVQSDGVTHQGSPAAPGFNMVYFSWMYGGNTTAYAPDNPEKTGFRRFRDLAVVEGLVRP